jgi:hypothetical protein
MRPRARALRLLRQTLAEEVRDYDEAVIRDLAVRRSDDATLAQETMEARVGAASRMRNALGAFLATLHDTPRSAELWRELEAIAPGLAADARQLRS